MIEKLHEAASFMPLNERYINLLICLGPGPECQRCRGRKFRTQGLR